MTADSAAGDQPGCGRPIGRWSSGMSSEHLDVPVVGVTAGTQQAVA